jgi:hypothetical protein
VTSPNLVSPDGKWQSRVVDVGSAFASGCQHPPRPVILRNSQCESGGRQLGPRSFGGFCHGDSKNHTLDPPLASVPGVAAIYAPPASVPPRLPVSIDELCRSPSEGADTDSDRAIRWLIALMVLTCDPLAVALTAAASARRTG